MRAHVFAHQHAPTQSMKTGPYIQNIFTRYIQHQMLWLLATAILMLCLSLQPAVAKNNQPQNTPMPWAVYYNDKAPIEAFDPYKLLVLDSKHHPALEPLKSRGKTVLGYLSLGEIASHRHYFERVKEQKILLQENPNWPNSFYVDTRAQFWTALVVEEIIPNMLRHGFDGIFIDTLDNPIHLEDTVDPKRYKGMKDAASRLIRTIRKHYPDIPIMMNRAFALLPDVEDHITYLLAESVRTDHNPKAKTYGMTTDTNYRQILDLIRQSSVRHPELVIFSLDYWDPKDSQTIKDIYAAQRANGFLPYVSTVDLTNLTPEPKP